MRINHRVDIYNIIILELFNIQSEKNRYYKTTDA